ncbi:MAG: response regulator transcription factor [bacterium]|nr:response regulator transcription factor [bacterium]
MKTIAIVEDDAYIGDLLAESLKAEGYRVLRAWSGTEALLLFEKNRPDLILLDLMLPGLSGEQLLPHIKNIPVIVVSAKAETDDKVKVLLEGAADYLTKPFEIRELLARITVQLRRGGQPVSPILTAGELVLNTDTRELLVRDRPIHLTRTEYALLKKLMQNPARPVSKSALLEDISADTPDCTESSLKIHISNLRKKIKEAGGEDCIESVWGIGFRLNPM